MFKNRSIILFLFFAALFISFSDNLVLCQSNRLEEYRNVRYEDNKTFEQFTKKVRDFYDVPAVAAAVVNIDGIIESASAGQASLDNGKKVNTGNRFHVGSCGKSMTSTLAAVLVENGVLSWKTTPLDIFPELETDIHKDFRTVTLLDIVSHRAGIKPFHSAYDIRNNIPEVSGSDMEKRRQFTFWLLKEGPNIEPGNYEYSNAGYSIAGAILEKVTGQTWQSLMKEKVFKPLGLKTASFGWPGDMDINEPSGHLSEHGQLYPASLEQNRIPAVFAPAGDICMSVEDFAKYVQMHLRGLNGKNGILKSETVKLLHSSFERYSCGWGVTKIDEEKISAHSGSGGTFFARAAVSHDKNSALVILANSANRKTVESFSNIFAEWFYEYVKK